MKAILLGVGLCGLAIVFAGTAFGQEPSGEGTRATDKDRDKAEENTASFDPADLYSQEAKHVVVFFDIDDGNLVLSSRPAQVVRGNLPYKPRRGGNFIVVAKDRNGEEITSYFTSDIRTVRVFEGEDRRSTRIRDIKDLILPIPFDRRITRLSLGSTVGEGEEETFDISQAVKEVFGSVR